MPEFLRMNHSWNAGDESRALGTEAVVGSTAQGQRRLQASTTRGRRRCAWGAWENKTWHPKSKHTVENQPQIKGIESIVQEKLIQENRFGKSGDMD